MSSQTGSKITNSQRKVAISLASANRLVDFIHPNMALHFVGKRRIASLHHQLFHDPSPTDCISLSFDNPHFLGEVFVCPEVACDYVSRHGGSLAREITLYVVHGCLHLLGYDDQTPAQQTQMRAEEKRWIALLAKKKLMLRIER